jgi:hypothetical protein
MDDRRLLDMNSAEPFGFEEPDTFTGVRCPECDSYLEEDGKWLYCLGCGYDEEEDSEE